MAFLSDGAIITHEQGSNLQAPRVIYSADTEATLADYASFGNCIARSRSRSFNMIRTNKAFCRNAPLTADLAHQVDGQGTLAIEYLRGT